jgi:hypothetical protein
MIEAAYTKELWHHPKLLRHADSCCNMSSGLLLLLLLLV